MNTFKHRVIPLGFFLLPLLVAFLATSQSETVNAWLNQAQTLSVFAGFCFLWGVLFPYLYSNLDGKFVDFMYYTFAIAGIVLLAQSQLYERRLVDAQYEMFEAKRDVDVLILAQEKIDSLIADPGSKPTEDLLELWMESPFVSLGNVGLLEAEYWLEHETLQRLITFPEQTFATIANQISRKLVDAQDDYKWATEAFDAMNAESQNSEQQTTVFHKLIELWLWPYLMCFAFAAKLASKRVI